MGQKGEDLMAFIDKPEMSVELPVSRYTEGSVLAKLCVDILTFLLFQRRQIPETVQILQRNRKTQNVKCPSNARQRQSKEPVRVQKQVSQLLDAVAAVNRSLSDLLRVKDVVMIHVLFGATPSSAKEIFTVNLKEFCLCKKPTQVPEKWISECSRKICKKLFMRNEFLDDSCALTNTYILAKATKSTKVAGWLPWPQYKFSEKKLRLEITLLPTSNGWNSKKEGDGDDKENQPITQNGILCSTKSKAKSQAVQKETFLTVKENKTRSLKEEHSTVQPQKHISPSQSGPQAACSADAASGGEAEGLDLPGNATHINTITSSKTDCSGDALAYGGDISDEDTPPMPVRARRYSAGERLAIDSDDIKNDRDHGSRSTPVASKIEDSPVPEYSSNTDDMLDGNARTLGADSDDMHDSNAETVFNACVSECSTNTDGMHDGNARVVGANVAPRGCSIEGSDDTTYNNAKSLTKSDKSGDASPHCHDEELLDEIALPLPVRVRRYSSGKSFIANSSCVTVEEPASDCKDVTSLAEKSWNAIQPSISADMPGLNSVDSAMPPLNDFEDVLTPSEMTEQSERTSYTTFPTSRRSRPYRSLDGVEDVYVDTDLPSPPSISVRRFSAGDAINAIRQLLLETHDISSNNLKKCETSETLRRDDEILTLEDREKLTFENCGIDSGKTGDICIESADEALPGNGIFAHEYGQILLQGGMPDNSMVDSSIKRTVTLPQGSPIRVYGNSLDEDSDSDKDPPPSVLMRRFSAGTVCDSLVQVSTEVNGIDNQAKANAHRFTSLDAPNTLNALDSFGHVPPEANGIDNLATPNAHSFISIDASSALDAFCDSKVVGQGARHQGIPNHLHEKDASSALDALCDSKVGGQSDQHLDVLAHQEEEERGKSHSLGLGDGGAGEPLLGASTKPDVSFNSMPLTACFGTDNEFKLKADSGTKLPSAPRETVLQQTGIAPETENMEQNKGFEEYMWFKSNIVIKGFRY